MQLSENELAQLLPCEAPDFKSLKNDLVELREHVLDLEKKSAGLLKGVHPKHLCSGRNLLQYLALRTVDVRALQYLLSEWGLSSLGRAERKVQATLDTVLAVMYALEGKKWASDQPPPVCFKEGRRLLEENTDLLLGPLPDGRRARIMVTMPTEAANDYTLVQALMEKGMNCARINCAHDDESVWERIIKNIRRAAEATGKNCTIHMDLGGPKLRTGPLEPTPTIFKVKPERNATGEVVSPAKIWLFPSENGQPSEFAAACLPVPSEWLKHCKKGDKLKFIDANGSERKMKIVGKAPEGFWAALKKTAYFHSGLILENEGEKAAIGELPTHENPISLAVGDALALTKKPILGRNANAELGEPAQIGCTIPDVLNDVRVGEQVWFDDGKIGSVVEKIEADRLLLRITQTKPGGDKLRSGKGINFPDSDLHLPALTAQDLSDLRFVAEHADTVGLSFANSAADAHQLIKALKQLKKSPGIVLKIETKRGFEHLPAMLLEVMKVEKCGVMIARGDLAIEAGFGRLAELQEQILWVCEAAHVPVIWATQVLEGMAKMGLPSRAEVTDAAMGQRAECIMLNKGEHILAATQALDEILHRMQDHQTKKRSTLRKLNLAELFFAGDV